MIQEIAPHSFANEYRARRPEPEANALVFRGDGVLCAGGAQALTLPRWGELDLPADRGHFAFRLDGAAVFLTDAEPGRIPAGFGFVSAPSLRHASPRHIAWAVGVGGSLMRWYRRNALCGACGAAMADSETERARVCPGCGAVATRTGTPGRRAPVARGAPREGNSIATETFSHTSRRTRHERFTRTSPQGKEPHRRPAAQGAGAGEEGELFLC